MFYRYVDDIIGIWEHGKETFDEFMQLANNIHPNIKVLAEYSSSTINFHDVKVTLQEKKFKTEIHTKETDQHIYVHRKSQHPKTTRKAIPYVLAIRAKHMCSDEDYHKSKNQIINHMQDWGYRSEQVKRSMKNADQLNRNILLQFKSKQPMPRVPLIVIFNDSLPNVQHILHKRMYIIQRSERLKKIFPEAPIAAFRRDQNIQDVVVHIKHSKQFEKKGNGTHHC